MYCGWQSFSFAGQFFCGNKCCNEKEGLRSWEVNFGYTEHGEKRNALVKLRLCQECSFKLNFHHRRKEIKSTKKKSKTTPECDESPRKKSRSPPSEEASKGKDEGHSSSKKSEDSRNRNAEEEDSASDSELWKGPLPETDEKSQEEEFDDYFQDLFLWTGRENLIPWWGDVQRHSVSVSMLLSLDSHWDRSFSSTGHFRHFLLYFRGCSAAYLKPGFGSSSTVYGILVSSVIWTWSDCHWAVNKLFSVLF